MTFTAVIHFKSKWPYVRLRYSESGREVGPWRERDWNSRTSPMGPFWTVVIITFEKHGLLFLPKCADDTGSDDEGPSPHCPTPWRKERHYFIGESGTFVLANGTLSKFSDDTSVERDALGADLPPSTIRSPVPRRSLFLDIDGTLRGNGVEHAFVDAWDRRLALSGAVLAFNTGRGIASVRRYLAETGSTLIPTVTVCRVGCSIFWFRERGRWVVNPKSVDCFLMNPESVEDADWLNKLDGEGGGWDIHKVLSKLRGELIMDPSIRARLCDPIGPVPREQRLFVVSFELIPACVSRAVKAVRGALADIKFKLSISGHGPLRYLDVICVAGGKLGGMRHVLRRLGPAFPPGAAVMAGDSGNDLDALDHDGPEKGIIVANAQKELVLFWEELVQRDPGQTRVVFTKRTCAEGVVEGLRTLNFL